MNYAILARSLEQSLRTRVVAFQHYVEALLAKNADASPAFRGALRLIRLYAKYLPHQLDGELDRSPRPTPEERFHIASALLEDLRVKIEETDFRFARGGQHEIPRALGSLLRREFVSLGLPDDLLPVLSIGVPGTFETRIEDLASFLFHDVMDLVDDYKRDPDFTGSTYALISLPHFEGTQVMWNPIVIGHEAAHLYIFRENNRHVEGSQRHPYSRQVHRNVLGGITEDEWRYAWLEEILCDLNAVRLYGPAAFAAMCEMLSGFDQDYDYLEHPPRFLRVRVMMTALERLGDSTAARGWWSPIVDPWEILSVFTAEFAATAHDRPAAALNNEQATFSEKVALAANSLVDEVLGWPRDQDGPAYHFGGRGMVIDAIGKRFSGHMTSGPSVVINEDRNEVCHDVLEADVVNAAWLAAARVSEDVVEYGRVVRLAGKSIDTLELIRLAGDVADELARVGDLPEDGRLVIATSAVVHVPAKVEGRDASSAIRDDDPVRTEIAGGSILSRSEIEARLFESRDLVIDPLFERAIGAAVTDLRLGPEFIVFRRTGTSEYDPLGEDSDYSSLQEVVSKGWGDKFILHPNELVLASTLEYIVLPTDLTGDITSRSSYGRLGLLTVTAAQVQPGSTGCITLELLNEGMTPIALTPGLRLTQMRLHRVAAGAARVGSKYDCAVGPEFPKVGEDWDKPVLGALRKRARVRAPRPR